MFNSFSSSDACKLLANGAQLVDVRSSEEFTQGALPNAISPPLQSTMDAEQVIDRDQVVILYCVTGARSSTAKNYLIQIGDENVNDLAAVEKIISKTEQIKNKENKTPSLGVD